MANPTPTPTDKSKSPTQPSAAPSDAEKEIAELRSTCERLQQELREQQEHFQAARDGREKEFAAQLAQAASAPTSARGRARLPTGEVTEMRARHALRYLDANGEPQRVAAKSIFRASLDEMAKAGHTEGDAFEVAGS